MKKELFLLLFFTNFLTASIQDLCEKIKDYGVSNFAKDIGGPAVISILFGCWAYEDLMFKMAEYCNYGRLACAMFGVDCYIKGCEEPDLFFAYCKCGVSIISGSYAVYNTWYFYTRNNKPQKLETADWRQFNILKSSFYNKNI